MLKKFWIAVLVCGLMGFGCTSRLSLTSLPDLPSHWRNVIAMGEDTKVGTFVSIEKTNLVIRYDIGPLAGEYAARKHHRNRKWFRSAQLAQSSFNYLLAEDDILYVTFPDEGPANFWTQVKGQSEIDYVLELLARHRQKLLSQQDSK
jgi:hypothetical protein